MTYQKIIVLSTILLFFTGCAAKITESGYYWGEYSESYYEYIKSPSEETVTNHFNTLNHIINKSSELGLKVPPGVYAELGFITANRGAPKDGVPFYEEEVKLYPESKHFIERLITGSKEK